MGIFCFPTNFVYWTNIEKHEIFKEKLMKDISNNLCSLREYSYVYNGKSTYKDPNFFPQECDAESKMILNSHPDMIKEVVWKSLEKAISELNSRNGFERISLKTSYIFNCWYSKYQENGGVKNHSHAKIGDVQVRDNIKYFPTFSLIYILHDESERNSTEFIVYEKDGICTNKRGDTIFDTGEIKDIKEGSVIIFPSNLEHYVKPILKSGRIILSFNIHSAID